MSQARPDLDSLASAFSNKAADFRRRAAEATATAASREGAHAAELHLREAADATAAASAWEARAATARAGLLLASMAEYGDPEFMANFGDALHSCQEAGLVTNKSA